MFNIHGRNKHIYTIKFEVIGLILLSAYIFLKKENKIMKEICVTIYPFISIYLIFVSIG